ncbi:putative tyrosine-protein phosphatase non-receptor type substrate 1-like, partial [Apostichopus japonicus]
MTVAEGSALTINCGLKQTTNVKWYSGTALGSNLIATMDGGTISVTDDAVYGLTEEGSLIIKSLQNEHAGQYTIEHVSSERIKERATVVINIKVLQLDCPEELVVKRGNNLTINCGLGEKPSVRWYNGTLSNLTVIANTEDGKKSVIDDKVFGIKQDASLIIKHIRPEQEGVYLVEHFMPDTSKESRTVAVKISGTITRCPEKVSNKDGSTIIINCHLDGMSSVKWYFGTSPNCFPIAKTENGTFSVAHEQIHGINANGSLIVKDLRHEQE